MALRLEALLHDAREREVHVVAAEQDVIADRDALEREVAVVLADEDQAEIGRAAADVAHEQQVADAELPPPALARAVDPRIAGGLRLLEQRHAREAGLGRGAKRQLARLFVERCRHGDQHVLPVERQCRLFRSEACIPRLPEMLQVARRRGNRRELRHLLRRAPRQNRRRAARAGIRQPRFGRRDEARRVLGSALPRQLTDDPPRSGVVRPWKAETVSRKIELAGDVEEGRQQRPLGDLSRVHELRDRQDLDRGRVFARQIGARHRGVGRTEIDPDAVSCFTSHMCSTRARFRPGATIGAARRAERRKLRRGTRASPGGGACHETAVGRPRSRRGERPRDRLARSCPTVTASPSRPGRIASSVTWRSSTRRQPAWTSRAAAPICASE